MNWFYKASNYWINSARSEQVSLGFYINLKTVTDRIYLHVGNTCVGSFKLFWIQLNPFNSKVDYIFSFLFCKKQKLSDFINKIVYIWKAKYLFLKYIMLLLAVKYEMQFKLLIKLDVNALPFFPLSPKREENILPTFLF